jgi:outer membrane protein assembly factor BamB
MLHGSGSYTGYIVTWLYRYIGKRMLALTSSSRHPYTARTLKCLKPVFAAWLLGLLLPTAASATEALTNEWAAELGSHSDSSPAIADDGTLYLGTWLGSLCAINPDGTRRWRFPVGNEIRSAPAIGADGTVYFGSRDRTFYAVSAQGKQKWAFKTGAWVDSSAALADDGTIYFGSWDTNLYALSPDGSKKWEFRTRGPVVSSPAVGNGGTIYFGSQDGKFYALRPDGTRLWEFPTSGAIISSPALDREGSVCFTSVDGYLYSLEPGGALRWRLHTGGVTESSPIFGQDGTLFVGVNTSLWAVAPQGTKKWDRADGYTQDTTALAFADDSIGYVSWYGSLIDLRPDMQVSWTFYMCNRHGYASPTIAADGTVYSADCSERLHALRTPLRLADSPWPKVRGNRKNTGNRNAPGN